MQRGSKKNSWRKVKKIEKCLGGVYKILKGSKKQIKYWR